MLHKRNIWTVLISILIVCLIVGSVVYHSLFINLFGSQIRKSQLQTVLVYSDQHAYFVNNPKLVEQISMETTSLERSHLIVPGNFPEYKVYFPMPKFVLQTKDHITFGGSIWADGHLIDANGYYWNMTPQLLELLRKSIEDNQTTKLF